MKAFAEGRGLMYGSFHSANRLTTSSNQRLCMANLAQGRSVVTPLKRQRKSMVSNSYSRSKSKSQSQLLRSQINGCSTPALLSNYASHQKIKSKKLDLAKWVKKPSSKRKKRSLSRQSLNGRSANKSETKSNNSNATKQSEHMKRD